MLVVDDERDVAVLIAHLLTNMGFQVSTAHDGLSGLEAIKTTLPDLVLLNHLMPGLTGLEVLERVRRDPGTEHIKVIIDSAATISSQALEMGAQGFIKMPFCPQDLCELVTRVLRP